MNISSRKSFPERSSAATCRSCFMNWRVPCRTSTAKRFSKKDPFYEVLQLIDAEFTTLTLDAASKRLNFNKNYLSNMIKKRSGQTFTELLNEKRLLKANLLIESTEIPILTILTEVGFSNKTYFYTCYKNRFHCLPSEVRKKRNMPRNETAPLSDSSLFNRYKSKG